MKLLLHNDTIQIEVTNLCRYSCSNCTRHIGHHKEPFFMEFDKFKDAVDSFKNFPKMVGIQGGEPLLHPQFEKMCEYLSSRFPKNQLGLWTTFPKGYEHYREIICDTFGHIFLNDHSKNDIYHHPSLIAIEEVIKDPRDMWYYIETCWAQEDWSASINPKGAYFCEMAASFAMLYPESPDGWSIEEGWWRRTPKDYIAQMEYFCPKCGMACPLKRRISTEEIDDISPYHLEKLKEFSPKIKAGKYEISDLKVRAGNAEPLAAYKEQKYRDEIAKRYGIFLVLNEFGFLSPFLYKDKENKFKKSELYAYESPIPKEDNLMFYAKETQWLNWIAKQMDSIVEIGSWKGGSTHALLSGCKGTVTAVDHFLGNLDTPKMKDVPEIYDGTNLKNLNQTSEEVYEAFMKNVGHFENLKVMKMDSIEASKQFEDKSIDMVFIDGDHNSDSVRKDIEAWLPKTKKILCGHDYHMPSVQEVLIEKFSWDDPENLLPLSYTYFRQYLTDMGEANNPAHKIYKSMIKSFRTIPGTTIWVLEIGE